MFEPEVVITLTNESKQDEINEKTTKRTASAAAQKEDSQLEPIKIKEEVADEEEFLNELYNIKMNSPTKSKDQDSSSSMSESSDASPKNRLSKVPDHEFISQTAQNICKMIEMVSNSTATSLLSLLNENNADTKPAIAYFLDYFPEQVFAHIANQMHFVTDASEIQELFGIHILINVLKYPRYDLYWSPLFKIQAITERISKERFDDLRNNLTIVRQRPPAIPNHPKDNLWRIRPIVNSFTKKCQLLAAELDPAVDAQIIPFLLYLNGIKLKRQRKLLRVLFAFVGLAVKNSWLEYKKDCGRMQKAPKDVMDLLEFTLKTAELLLRTDRHCGGGNASKRQRSTSDESPDENSGCLLNQLELMPVNKKARLSNSPFIRDIRYDGVDHWPIMDKKPQRCKLENCPKKASVKCYKCNLHLCMSSNRNCFMAFHVRP